MTEPKKPIDLSLPIASATLEDLKEAVARGVEEGHARARKRGPRRIVAPPIAITPEEREEAEMIKARAEAKKKRRAA